LGLLTFLMTITLFFYVFMTTSFGSKDDIYVIGILAGATGAFWSKGIGVLDKFNKKIEKEIDWISRKEYKKYRRNWIIVCILSAFGFAIMWLLVH